MNQGFSKPNGRLELQVIRRRLGLRPVRLRWYQRLVAWVRRR